MYPFLHNIVYFVKNTFVKKTKYPIISIILFIIVIILNSIQYNKNDKNYLQNQIIVHIKTDTDGNIDYSNTNTNINNTLLYIYDFISINGFLDYTPNFIFFYIITYFCLSLVELNIGHFALLFLLLIDIMFQFFWDQYQAAICSNELSRPNRLWNNPPYCCGSFILFISLGFILYLIQKNIKNIYNRIFSIIILIGIYFLCLPIEIYSNYVNLPDGPEKTCKMFTMHGANYLFGVLCASVLSN